MYVLDMTALSALMKAEPGHGKRLIATNPGEIVEGRLERQGPRLEDLDLTIAAHALAYEATLVTSNVKHFRRISGLEVEDWSD